MHPHTNISHRGEIGDILTFFRVVVKEKDPLLKRAADEWFRISFEFFVVIVVAAAIGLIVVIDETIAAEDLVAGVFFGVHRIEQRPEVDAESV